MAQDAEAQIVDAQHRMEAARSRALDCARAGDHQGLNAANADARAAADEIETLQVSMAIGEAEAAEATRKAEVDRQNDAREEARKLVEARREHAARFDRALEELSAAYGMLKANSRAIEAALARAGERSTGLSGSDVPNLLYASWQLVDFARQLRLPHVGAGHRTTMAEAAMRRVPQITDEEA
jgi:hypothetical protein